MSSSQRPSSSPAHVLCLAGALLLLSPRGARAESSITYKYEDYREAGGRVGVQAQYALIEQSLGSEARLKLSGVIDVIAGATPTGEPAATVADQVPLTHMQDRRKAWTADYTRQFGRVNVDVGVANSRESDYVSNGVSLNTVTDFNDKNTSLVLGISGTDDRVKVFYQADRVAKHGLDAVVGVNQLLDPKTSVTFDLTFGRTTGYLSDPYKIIEQNTEILPGLFLPLTFPENRPGERSKWVVFLGCNHAFDQLNGALDAGYRLYHDTYGTTSHTLTAAWVQRLGAKVILEPSFRFYQQGAADFYRLSLDGSSIEPGDLPNPAGPFFSSDYRLSRMRSLTYGLKLVWNPTESVGLDLAYDRYEMKGLDGITPHSAYTRAAIVTGGVHFTW